MDAEYGRNHLVTHHQQQEGEQGAPLSGREQPQNAKGNICKDCEGRGKAELGNMPYFSRTDSGSNITKYEPHPNAHVNKEQGMAKKATYKTSKIAHKRNLSLIFTGIH